MTSMRALPIRLALALVAPLILWGCVLTPGKFVSTLTVNADRSFAFAYKGEVIAVEAETTTSSGDTSEGADNASVPAPATADKAALAATEVKRRGIAEALSKEAGYRSVVYKGDGKFEIDYAIRGTLDHGFVFPFNPDAQALVPFVMIELRQNNVVRVRAPAFGAPDSGFMGGMAGVGPGAASTKFLDGMFTLDTDAEIVSQNNEDGAAKAGGRHTIAWRATPTSATSPTAVLKLAR